METANEIDPEFRLSLSSTPTASAIECQDSAVYAEKSLSLTC